MTDDNNTKTIPEVFSELHERRHELTAWQFQFIDSVQRQWKKRHFVSDQQFKIMKDILKFL